MQTYFLSDFPYAVQTGATAFILGFHQRRVSSLEKKCIPSIINLMFYIFPPERYICIYLANTNYKLCLSTFALNFLLKLINYS